MSTAANEQGIGRAAMSDVAGIAEALLARWPHAVPHHLIPALRPPTQKSVYETAASLLAAGHLDAARFVFQALAEQPQTSHWAFLGLARVAARQGEPRSAAAIWRDCFERFADHVAPNWIVELAHAEQQSGNADTALELLRGGVERFPACADLLVASADVLFALGRKADAITELYAVVLKFPDRCKSVWLIRLAWALRTEGRSTEEAAVVEKLAARFPDELEALTYRAQTAARNENWAGAWQLWQRILHLGSGAEKPEWLDGCALALFRLWRVSEALEMWRAAARRFPEYRAALANLGVAHEDLGQWDVAEEIWASLIRDNPDQVTFRWYEHRLLCRCNQPFKYSGDREIAEFERQFPDSAVGRRLALSAAQKRMLSLDAYGALVDEAVARFPADRALKADYVRLLLASGRILEAERVVTDLETVDDHYTLISRWCLAMDRDGTEAIRKSISDAVQNHVFGLSSGRAICAFLYNIRSDWSSRLTLQLCEELERKWPGRINLIWLKVRAMIGLRRDSEAIAQIDDIHPLFQSPDVLELRAWAAAKRNDHLQAARIWTSILAAKYFPAVNGPAPALELLTPERMANHPDGVTAFSVVRDELPNLPHFLHHHRQLGIRRFVIVDNMSIDGTIDYLRAQPDVVLYQTPESYSASNSGMRWINFLFEQSGAGRWCLYVDADEDFIYPGWETVSVNAFAQYLDARGAEAVAGFMLDVYPERLVDDHDNPATHSDCRYYDRDYLRAGDTRCPWFTMVGGVRMRLFGAEEHLDKVPLIKSGRGIHLSAHRTTPLRLAEVTSVLFHYKMIDLFTKAGHIRSPHGQNFAQRDHVLEGMRRHERYASRLPVVAKLDLRVEAVTEPLVDSLSLADHGLMQAPHHFRQWLEEQAL